MCTLRDIAFCFCSNWKEYDRTDNLILLMTQTELSSVHNWKGNCQYKNCPFNLKGSKIDFNGFLTNFKYHPVSIYERIQLVTMENDFGGGLTYYFGGGILPVLIGVVRPNCSTVWYYWRTCITCRPSFLIKNIAPDEQRRANSIL